MRQIVLDALVEVAPEVDVTTLDPSAPLQDELDLDSMDLLSLYTLVNERTGIEIPERDYDRLRTLDGLVTYLAAGTAGVA